MQAPFLDHFLQDLPGRSKEFNARLQENPRKTISMAAHVTSNQNE